MPTTVTASNGNTYHLYQLPDLSSPEPEASIAFTTLDNDLSDGYRSTRLFGSNTGVRKWKLNLPRLAGSTIAVPFVTDINGASVSREEYIWSLYTENKVTGTPFAYTDPRTGQYYLVDFQDDELSFQRMKVKLYSTGLTLRQRRLSGVTIFNPMVFNNGSTRNMGQWNEDHGVTQWKQTAGDVNWSSFLPTGDVVFSANPQNGLNTVRFSGSASTGVAALDVEGLSPYSTAYDIFLVMQVREATFSNTAGILTHTSSGQVLVGSSGTNKFTNLSHSDYEYRLNDVEYVQSNQVAPMNAFGLVHLRFAAGKYLNQWQIGKDRATGGTFAKIDVAELLIGTSLLSKNNVREIVEFLTIKWGITA